MGCTCGENADVKLVYACSGAANTGLLADQVARTLMREGYADMTCLSAVGADLSGFIQSARAASRNIVIDGCPVACGKRIFKNKNLPCDSYILTDFGVQKGKTPITGNLIEDIAVQVKEKIGV